MLEWSNIPYKGSQLRIHIWVSARENLSSRFANNKGADQPAHPRTLDSAYGILFLERIVSKLARREKICLRGLRTIKA